MQPINYKVEIGNPIDSAVKGLQQGFALQDQQLQRTQQQAALAQQQQMQADLAALSNKKNPTSGDYISLVTRYPALSEKLKDIWSPLSAEQQKNKISSMTQVLSALKSGNTEVATDLLQRQADAARNSGDENSAKALETMAGTAKINPKAAIDPIALTLSSAVPEKFDTLYKNLLGTPSDVAQSEALADKTRAEANNTPERLFLESNYKKAQVRDLDSQIAKRAEQLNFDKDKLQTEVQMKLFELDQKKNPATTLGDDARKIINDSAINSVTSEQSSSQMLDLANRIQKDAPAAGWAGSGLEFLKKATGNQDAVSEMKQEFLRIRNSQVLKFLPPGPASDKDIELAKSGFPNENANPDTIASFLRGMAKLNQYNAVLDNAKSEWVNNVGHLGKAKQEIEIDGVKVPAGATFNNFAGEFLAKKQQELAQRQAQQNLPTRSYMQLAQPQGQ